MKKKQHLKQPSKLLYLYLSFGALNAAIILSYAMIVFWIQSLEGDSRVGASLAFGLLYGLIFLVALVLSIIVFIGLPIYIYRHKLRGKWLYLSLLALLASSVPLIMAGNTAYQLFIKIPADTRAAEQEYLQKERLQNLLTGTSYTVTKDEALKLLDGCRITEFHYENQNSNYSVTWGELSNTGIVVGDVKVTDKYGQPLQAMSVSDKMAKELLQVADETRAKCGRPDSYKNGEYQ